MKFMVFCIIILCGLERTQRSGGTYNLCVQGHRVSQETDQLKQAAYRAYTIYCYTVYSFNESSSVGSSIFTPGMMKVNQVRNICTDITNDREL
jgi:hypothetical protein